MPEWLHEALDAGPRIDTEVILVRVALAWAAGFVVAGVYVFGVDRQRDEGRTLPTTLALLTVVIAVVTQVIGDNLARAFGLVGALSIVRFRTVVEDTRDTAFVIFAVVVGMAIGAGYPKLAAIGIPAMLLVVLVMRRSPTPAVANDAATLTVRVGLGNDPEAMLAPVFAQHLAEYRLTGTSTAKQGAALEATYKTRLKPGAKAFALVAELNKIEGVQGVELKS
jgi:uncharacterized membrane protein YhiD involved in acid resistance